MLIQKEETVLVLAKHVKATAENENHHNNNTSLILLDAEK